MTDAMVMINLVLMVLLGLLIVFAGMVCRTNGKLRDALREAEIKGYSTTPDEPEVVVFEVQAPTEADIYIDSQIRKADGDVAEAMYWVFDALPKSHGDEARHYLLGDRDAQFTRLKFKELFYAFAMRLNSRSE